VGGVTPRSLFPSLSPSLPLSLAPFLPRFLVLACPDSPHHLGGAVASRLLESVALSGAVVGTLVTLYGAVAGTSVDLCGAVVGTRFALCGAVVGTRFALGGAVVL
jgi:hypothetical protein